GRHRDHDFDGARNLRPGGVACERQAHGQDDRQDDFDGATHAHEHLPRDCRTAALAESLAADHSPSIGSEARTGVDPATLSAEAYANRRASRATPWHSAS